MAKGSQAKRNLKVEAESSFAVFIKLKMHYLASDGLPCVSGTP